jgi:hypothetical protein
MTIMTIRMNKKMTAVLCIAFLLCCCLSGCRLALPDKGDGATGDRLIGAYITYESLDMPVMDALDDGSTVTVPADQRIFAKEKTVKKFGHKTKVYEFAGIRGIALFDPGLAKKGDYITSCPQTGDEIMEQNVAVTNSDSEKLSGTIYFASSAKDRVLFLNPVRETSDGRVYVAQGGPGCGTSSDGSVIGQAMSQTISETTTAADNNKKTSFTMTVEVTMKFANAPMEIIFKQLNDQDKIIDVTTVTANTIPKEIVKKPDTAYIIVENHGVNYKNKSETTREILNNDTDFYICKFFNKEGIAVGKSIEIK